MQSKTLTASINRGTKSVYEYVSDLSNLPRWATTFCLSIKKAGDDWIAQTPQGEARIRMTPRNDFGVLDHTVIPSPGVEIFVPVRVVKVKEGSEIIFTLFQHPGMTNEQFEQDQKFVREDLASLKRILETKTAAKAK
jgi:hypothetical protein